uniref:RNA-dependent RNA polymerase n=1 Tax=Suillus luteus narnavirus 1 TaxID=3067820 RepID=A0AA50A8X3_9VIRU|nr:RNA-dependent RNA polymerase [Suillus luteus narnavirus 1]
MPRNVHHKRPVPKEHSLTPFTSVSAMFSWIDKHYYLNSKLTASLFHGVPKGSRRIANVSSEEKLRFTSLSKNFDQLVAGYIHAYGLPKHSRFGTKNYKLCLNFVKMVAEFVQHGITPIKVICHHWRAIALGDHERSKILTTYLKSMSLNPTRHLLIASTMARSITVKVTERDKEEAVNNCIRRWTSLYSPVPNERLTAVKQHVTSIFQRVPAKMSETYSSLLPAEKACLERKIVDGGTSIQMYKNFEMCVAKGINLADPKDTFNYPPLKPFIPLQEMHNYRQSSQFSEIQERIIKLKNKYSEYIPTMKVPEYNELTAFRTARSLVMNMRKAGQPNKYPAIPDSYTSCEVKPTIIEELGGKIRVASIHPSYLAHFSRNMAERLIPNLMSIPSMRNSITGKVRLKATSRDAVLYSADLTAASDYIEHSLGRHILLSISRALKFDKVTEKAMLRCISSFEITGTNEVTRGGAHMGLGVTWTVLCLMNHYAATVASDAENSFAICGDDLVAYWTPHQIKIYESIMSELGLVLNTSKSYTGESGVFCEKLISKEVKNRKFASSIDIPKISELTSVKSLPTRTTFMDWRQQLRSSESHLTKYVIKKSMSKFSRHLPSVHQSLGGNGHVRDNIGYAAQIISLLQSGKMDINTGLSADLKKELNSVILLSTQKRDPNTVYVPVDDIIVDLTINYDRETSFRGEKLKKRRELPRKVVRSRALQRERQMIKYIDSALALQQNAPRLPKVGSVFSKGIGIANLIESEVLSSTRLDTQGRRRVLFYTRQLRRNINKPTKSLARLLNVISQTLTSGYIPLAIVEDLMTTHGVKPRMDQRGTEIMSWWVTGSRR